MPDHTLVTFLGRPQLQDGRYRKATYRFPDDVNRCNAFFGLALAEYLQPENVVILGTCGSMWGVLVSSLVREVEDENTEPALRLLDAEMREEVTDAHLDDTMANIMTNAIGTNVIPRLIDFGRDAEEQHGILQAISLAVPEGNDVSFDLTHGFRHLGMVGFLSAFMLEQVGNIRVRSLWYGALDMTSQGVTPVLKLDGLDRVRRWVDALNRFDACGDYGVFAPLLIADSVPKEQARCLERAAFHERTLNLSSAAAKIRTFLPALDQPLPGASELFRERLRERLAWVGGGNLAQCQRKLAFVYLERSDFIRAAMFGWEALATQECIQRLGCDINNFEDRRTAIEALEQEFNGEFRRDRCRRNAFFTLRSIRNALAHGNPPRNPRILSILRDADRLRNEMDSAFQILLN